MAPKRPDMVKKQERVKKILDEPAVQEKMKKKVAKKRDRKCVEAIVKAGGVVVMTVTQMLSNSSQKSPRGEKRKSHSSQSLSQFQIKVPNQKAFEVDTPENQIKMHQLLLAVAKKGGGKSTAVCNLLSFLKKDKVPDRLFVITSSWESNKPLFDFLDLPIDKEDVYDPDKCAADTIEDIISKATQETKEYDEYHHKMYLHKQEWVCRHCSATLLC